MQKAGQVMNIYSDIDTKATSKNVDYFLSKKLPHIILRCGHSITELSSPKLSLAPASTNITDRQESIIINAMEFEHVVQAVHSSIFLCSNISKTILIDKYIRNYPVKRIVMDIPYEYTSFYKKYLPSALLEFADLYSGQQLKCKVSKENLIDLHVYKN